MHVELPVTGTVHSANYTFVCCAIQRREMNIFLHCLRENKTAAPKTNIVARLHPICRIELAYDNFEFIGSIGVDKS